MQYRESRTERPHQRRANPVLFLLAWLVCLPTLIASLMILAQPFGTIIASLLFLAIAGRMVVRCVQSEPPRCDSVSRSLVGAGWIVVLIVLLHDLPQTIEMWRFEAWQEEASPLPKYGAIVTKKHGEWDIRSASDKLNDSTFLFWGPKMLQLGVQNLNLQGTQISDESLGQIKNIDSLRTLDLTGTKISDRGLSFIGRMKNLEVLLLNGTQVTDNGVANLAATPKLCRIGLRDTKVSGVGLQRMGGNRSLRYLDIMNTDVTSSEAEAFGRLRPDVCVIGPGQARDHD